MQEAILALTRKQVREVDRLAIEKYHVPGIVLMENAARGAAELASQMLGSDTDRYVVILCGGGNNGGDGLAIARHLHNRRYRVSIGLCTDPAHYKGDALINWKIVQAMGLDIGTYDDILRPIPPPGILVSWKQRRPNLIVDAIFGTGLLEAPRPPFDLIVPRAASNSKHVLAIDIPSGLDCDTGRPFGPCIRAERTITFVAPKIGFQNAEAKQYLGIVTIADIGCPREAIDEAIRMHP